MYGKASEPSSKIPGGRMSRWRNVSSAAAVVSPHEGHWSVVRSEPQSRHRVMNEPQQMTRTAVSSLGQPHKGHLVKYRTRADARADGITFAGGSARRSNPDNVADVGLPTQSPRPPFLFPVPLASPNNPSAQADRARGAP